MKERYYIGVDLGGTNIRVGLVTEHGVILEEFKEKTEAHLGNEQIINKIVTMIQQLKLLDKVAGIGIGTPGLIDQDRGIVVSAANLGFVDFPLQQEIQKHFNVSVQIANDANVAALAEAIHGAGKNKKIVQYLTISTGIGGGLIINGKIVSGVNGCAGEIGNLIVGDDVFDHPLFNNGAFELKASGVAITKKGQVYSKDIVHAGHVFELAKSGNREMESIYNEFIDSVALAMSHIAHVVDPDVFVIGGGVSNVFHLFKEDLEKKYRQYIFNFMHKNVNIQKALLEDPGIVGAAMLNL